jgi:MerR family transcriptional regulator, light-induced transcriptional regulator
VENIERLTCLRELTTRGHRIGHIAATPTSDLQALLAKDQGLSQLPRHRDNSSAAPARKAIGGYIAACCAAVRALDGELFRAELDTARIELGHRTTLRQIVAPVIAEIGEGWRDGATSLAQEHLHTIIVREFLSAPIPGASVPSGAPELIVATPAGTVHELGALLVVATARDLGWRVTYLGPSLPAEEIARVSVVRCAQFVAISIVYPTQCPTVAAEIRQLRSLLPDTVGLTIGGRAAASYIPAVGPHPGIHWTSDLAELESLLLR